MNFMFAHLLMSNECIGVVPNLLDTHITFGVPPWIHSDSGREFAAVRMLHLYRWLRLPIAYGAQGYLLYQESIGI